MACRDYLKTLRNQGGCGSKIAGTTFLPYSVAILLVEITKTVVMLLRPPLIGKTQHVGVMYQKIS